MKVRNLIGVAAAACSLISLIVAVMVFLIFSEVEKLGKENTDHHRVTKHLSDLEFLTYDNLINPAERPREQWLSKFQSLEAELDRMSEHLIDDPELSQIVEPSQRLKTLFVELTSQPLAQTDNSLRDSQLALQQRKLSQLMVLNRELVAKANMLETKDFSETKETIRRYKHLAFAFTVTLIFFIVAATFVIWRTISLPLASLQDGTRIIGAGNLNHRMGINRDDEFGALASSFDQMADNLRSVTTSKSRLETEIARRERLEADLKRSNRDLEQFAYIASHDLQEPLRMVSSFVQLLERKYGDQLDDTAREFIGFATDGANRMKRLINDLLAFSRVTTRGAELTNFDLGQAVWGATEKLKMTIQENGALVNTEASLPPARGDEIQITQIFQNLIGNALKFHGENQPVVVIDYKSRADGMLEISVSDNGIGIDEKHFERIFDIFQRLHGRDEYKGTGIGLALVKRIVERHGGHVWVDSKPGEGTTFYFTLHPAKTETSHDPAESPAAEQAAATPARSAPEGA